VHKQTDSETTFTQKFLLSSTVLIPSPVVMQIRDIEITVMPLLGFLNKPQDASTRG